MQPFAVIAATVVALVATILVAIAFVALVVVIIAALVVALAIALAAIAVTALAFIVASVDCCVPVLSLSPFATTLTAAIFAEPVTKFNAEQNSGICTISNQHLKRPHDAKIAGSKMEPALVQCCLALCLVWLVVDRPPMVTCSTAMTIMKMKVDTEETSNVRAISA